MMKKIVSLFAVTKCLFPGLLILTCLVLQPAVGRAQGSDDATDSLSADFEPAILDLVEVEANAGVWEGQQDFSSEFNRIAKERGYISSAAYIIKGGNLTLARQILATRVGDLGDHVRRYRQRAQSPDEVDLDFLAWAFVLQGQYADAERLLPFVRGEMLVEAINRHKTRDGKDDRQARGEAVDCKYGITSDLLPTELLEEAKRTRRPPGQNWIAAWAFVLAAPCIVNEDIRQGRVEDSLELLADATETAIKNSKSLVGMDAKEASSGARLMSLARQHLIQTLSYLSTRGVELQQELARHGRSAKRHAKFPDLPLHLAVRTVRGKGAREIVTFQDPNEPFSKALAKQLATMKNVTVYTFLVSMHGGDSKDKARAVWCSADRAKALDDLMVNGQFPAAPANDCVAPAELVHELGRKLQLTSTPVIFLSNGRRIVGMVSAKHLDTVLADRGDTTQTKVGHDTAGGFGETRRPDQKAKAHRSLISTKDTTKVQELLAQADQAPDDSRARAACRAAEAIVSRHDSGPGLQAGIEECFGKIEERAGSKSQACARYGAAIGKYSAALKERSAAKLPAAFKKFSEFEEEAIENYRRKQRQLGC